MIKYMIKKINEVLKGLSKFERALIYLYVIGIASYSYFLTCFKELVADP
jgi:hypothetical protein